MSNLEPHPPAAPAAREPGAPVDVLIQTYNEELNLPHTLASVMPWASRVFVVDSGSTDRTVGLAESAGATVVYHGWEGYAAQKNWALDHLPFESPWVLIVDADEAVTDPLRDEIVSLVGRDPEGVPEAGFYLNRVLIFNGGEIRHCGYFPSWNLRLFKRGRARYEQRLVHEHMIVDGPTGHLKHLLRHEDRRGLEHFYAKHNRYSTLEARENYENPEPWTGWASLARDRTHRRRFLKSRVLPQMPVPWVFRLVYMYALKMGFLDGWAGWRFSNFISTYEFLIQSKYQELKRLRGAPTPPARGLSEPEGQISRAVEIGATPTVRRGITPATPSSGEIVQGGRARAGKAPVSVMIPTKNEAGNLPRCLDHLTWADEVVIVDSGSADGTADIARRYGATVVNFDWNGRWPKKKNWALRHVEFRNEWVLIVDADEWIMPELAAEIGRAVAGSAASADKVGYYVNRRFIFMGRWIKHCGYYPSWNLRLVKRGHGEYEQLTGVGNTGSGDNEVHEHVIADGAVGYLDHDMLHLAFPSIHTFMEKHNRYSNWEAAVQHERADTVSAAVDGGIGGVLGRRRRLKNLSRRLPFRPTLRFLYSYVWKRGFLDGRPGYTFCRLLGIYEFLSVAKYAELRRAEEDRRAERSLSAVPSAWMVEDPEHGAALNSAKEEVPQAECRAEAPAVAEMQS